MEWICHLGGSAGANIFSVASVDDFIMWAWLLIAAEMAVCTLLRKEAQADQLCSRPLQSAPADTPRNGARLVALEQDRIR